MIDFKYVLKNIIRNPIICLLIVIQLSVSIGIIYSVISYERYYDKFYKDINNIMSNSNNTWLIKSNELDPFKIQLKAIENLQEYLQKNKKFDFVSSVGENFATKPFEKSDDFLETTNSIKYNNENFSIIKSIVLNEKAYKYFQLKAYKGEDFKDIDYKETQGNEVPLILGYNYHDIFKVGDVIEYLRGDKVKKAKVIGILEKNTMGFIGDPSRGIATFDDYLVLPQIETSNNYYYNDDMDKSTSLYNYIFNSSVIANSGENKEEILQGIDNIAVENNIDLKLSSLAKNMESLKNKAKEQQQSSIVLGIIILIFAVVGLISSLLHSINKNIKEYGVHLMAGATKPRIAFRVFMQIVITVGLSYLIALNYILIRFSHTEIMKLNAISVFYTTVLVIILIVIISVLPMMKISKLDINQLMKEDS